MRINTYKTIQDENYIPSLVKESASNYAEIKHVNYNTPSQISDLCRFVLHMDEFAEEYLYMLAFNSKMRLTGIFEVSHGTVNQSMVSTRSIFTRALLCGAVSIVLAHNHPSGDVTPSNTDLDVTKSVREAGDLIDIQVVDHLIIGKYGQFLSMKEQGLFADHKKREKSRPEVSKRGLKLEEVIANSTFDTCFHYRVYDGIYNDGGKLLWDTVLDGECIPEKISGRRVAYMTTTTEKRVEYIIFEVE